MPITLPSDPSDGQVAPASWGDAVRTALSYLAGIVSPGDAGAWTSWTPTWTNLTVGNGTVNAAYAKVGRTVQFRLLVTFGSTTSMSELPAFTLPVTAASVYGAGEWPIGSGTLLDAGTKAWIGAPQVAISDPAKAYVRSDDGSGGWRNPSSTVPFTWTTTDKIMLSGTYEAAS